MPKNMRLGLCWIITISSIIASAAMVMGTSPSTTTYQRISGAIMIIVLGLCNGMHWHFLATSNCDFATGSSGVKGAKPTT